MTTTDRIPARTPRLNLAELIPDVYRALVRFDAAAREGLDPTILELVRIRASQVNHCAFCLDMHSSDALAAGETVQRIVSLSAWEESPHFYSAREVAAIELTDAITVLTDGFVSDAVYDRAAAQFDTDELAHLIAAITAINAWNRFGVASRRVPGV